MTKPKPLTTAETLKDIQQNRIAYGADERARYVEHVCAILLDSRMGPGASDDMFVIEDHEAKDALPSYIDLFDAMARYPVAVRDGNRIVELSPGQAIHLFLTDPDCGITILATRTKPADGTHRPSPIDSTPPNGPPRE